MNVNNNEGFSPNLPPAGPATSGPGNFPPMNNALPSPTGNGSALNYDSQVNPSTISMGNSALNGANVMAASPLQDQNLSGGLMGTIEDMLQQFLAKLQNLLRMSTGENDGVQGQQPATASSSALQDLAPLAASSAAPAASSSPNVGNVRLAMPSESTGDTSMKTSDHDLQKLVDKYGPEYEQASKETGVPAKLLVALTMQESGGDVNAKSTNPGNGKTDSGMNQINPDTYAGMRAAHPDKLGANADDPKNQIMCSALMLKEGKDKFGSYDAALRAYNSGDDQVDKNDLSHVTLGDPNYVKEVNAYAAKFH